MGAPYGVSPCTRSVTDRWLAVSGIHTIADSMAQTRETERALVPVTAKMVVDSSIFSKQYYENYLASPATVRLLGRTVDISTTEKSTTFTLDDGTGDPLPGFTAIGKLGVSEGCYAHVVGKVKKDEGGQASIHAFSCWALDDYNDITHHFLYAIHAYLERVGLRFPEQPSEPLKTTVAGTGIATGEENFQIEDWMYEEFDDVPAPTELAKESIEPEAKEELAARLDTGNDIIRMEILAAEEHEEVAATQEEFDDAELRQKIIAKLKDIQPNDGFEGVSINDIINGLCDDAEGARKTLKKLEELGEIYQTIDDDHYRAT